MIKIAICDDDLNVADEIQALICKQGNPNFYKFYVFDDGNKLLASDFNSYDIIFLDIEIGDTANGIDIGVEIKKTNKSAIIYFVTSYYHYISLALRQIPFQYILKPIKNQEEFFMEEFSRGLNQLRKTKNKILIKSITGDEFVKIQSIKYVECLNRKIEVHLIDGVVLESYGKIKELYSKLSHYNFIRCHVSFLINLNYIAKIKGYEAILVDGTSLPISKRYISIVKEAHLKFMAGICV